MIKKILITGMKNNTSENMTEQPRHREKNEEKCLEKDRRYYEEKERLPKII